MLKYFDRKIKILKNKKLNKESDNIKDDTSLNEESDNIKDDLSLKKVRQY